MKWERVSLNIFGGVGSIPLERYAPYTSSSAGVEIVEAAVSEKAASTLEGVRLFNSPRL